MLMSSMLGAAAFVTLGGDALNAPRNAFGDCLKAYVDKAVSSRTSKANFAREYPNQCQPEERAFREAIRAKEAGLQTPADQIEEFVKMEIEDLRANWRTRFDDGR